MHLTGTIPEQMRELRCCVIIPTYNNDGTLERVIRGVEAYTGDIIVVNDGSSDRTSDILAQFPQHHVVTIPQNRGKGNALREGFKNAMSLGFRYAISIDSDGQHYPEDIPEFVKMISDCPDSLIVGARNMSQEGIPGGSSFGHKFSIFWFRVETGLKIADVQTGYRLYPLEKIRSIHFRTRKYEFEVEALVRSAWHGIRILSVPVKVWYAPKGERVSHFRKFRDFARTSILNAILVFSALLWIRPSTFVRSLRKKSLKELFREHILNSKDSNIKLAASVALGTAFSALPIWGWQMVAAVAAAYALRLNKFITLLFSNLSIPPFMPFMIFFSYIAGGWVLGKSTSGLRYDQSITLKWIELNIVQYLVGSLVLSLIFGLALGILAYLLLSIFRTRKQQPPAA
jgi:glycosyltransferase involved in cell wall biosynthesis